jgi:hypothetical protein
MDPEIKEAFSVVREDLRNLNEHVRRVDGRVGDLDTRVGALDTRVGELDTRLSAEIQQVETALRQEIREEGITTRRHFDVVAESLRDDIRIIAEGLIALGTKVEAMRG